MVDYLRRPVAHEAFFKKYASKKFLKGESRVFIDVGEEPNADIMQLQS